MTVTGNQQEMAEQTTPKRNEAILVLLYFALYMAYLFLNPENELLHWFSLVVLPFGALLVLRNRKISHSTFRATLESAGLQRENMSNGIVVACAIGLGLSILQLFLSRNADAILETIKSGRVMLLFPLTLLLMLATAGFTEEFFFRGILQSRLQEFFRSNVLAVLVASVLFGLYHLPYAYLHPHWPSHGNWAEAFSAAMGQGIPVGLILGIVYVRTKNNLLAAIIVHSLINTLPAMTMIKIGGS